MIFLTFLTAIALSGIAAYYSVIGLTAIFVGAFWPIIFMGGSLEIAKLVTTSWLYRNWNTSPKLFRYYLTFSVVILMLITSMGIFGFLSKAHIEQTTSMGPLADQVAVYDEKINTLKVNIDENRKTLKQLDAAVDQVMARTDDAKGAERSVQIRKTQQKDRLRISQEISDDQKEIDKLTVEKTPLANELRKAEADFGPIKYVAEMFYGEGRDSIDKAVRLVIFLIMVVFDRLAILLLIAANMSMIKKRDDKKDTLSAETYVTDATETTIEPEHPVENVKDEEEIVEPLVIDKENLAIVIDEASGESIPPIGGPPEIPVFLPKTKNKNKKLKPKYDYTEPYSFREKEDK